MLLPQYGETSCIEYIKFTNPASGFLPLFIGNDIFVHVNNPFSLFCSEISEPDLPLQWYKNLLNMKPDDLETERKRLIETLGVYFEKEKQIAPLAARILATLVLNGKQGTTFEQLVIELEAGKSTISTHLNNLETQQWITHFTKTGDRKRYYTITPGYTLRRINILIAQWNKEIELHKQIIDYKSNYNKAHKQELYSLAQHRGVLQFLIDSVTYFRKQTEEYNSNNKKNNIEEL